MNNVSGAMLIIAGAMLASLLISIVIVYQFISNLLGAQIGTIIWFIFWMAIILIDWSWVTNPFAKPPRIEKP